MKLIDIQRYRRQQSYIKMNSAFYIGRVFHKRLTPKLHQFTYPLYMMFLDLDETERLHDKYWWFSTRRWAPLQFKVADYFKSTTNSVTKSERHSGIELKKTALNIAQSLGANTDSINRVSMLAQLRCFGFYFSPVNFFFLYAGNEARYLLAEVSNTPWNEKHCYLIDLINTEEIPKRFHVSPFMNLDMVYKWLIKPPGISTYIRIENWNENKLFTAFFSAKRHEITEKNVCKVFLAWPAVTLSILKGIYLQALRLFLKGIPYVPYQVKI